MAAFAASLLDELMGRNRNLAPTEKSTEQICWTDPDVCKYFLCGFCPHDLFTNTRADLGMCSKLHDDELIKTYRRSSRYLKMGYEEQFIGYLQTLVGDVDKRIKRGHQRLALNKEAANLQGAPQSAHEEKTRVLSERINDLVEQAERLGCEGRVEEAQGVLKLCDQLKEERAQLQEVVLNQLTPKEMEVCEICGAFLVVGDAPQRVQEHLEGKQHVGYARCREAIDDIKKKLRGDDPERETRLKREREEYEQHKQRERERASERDREKERRRAEEDAERHRGGSGGAEGAEGERSRSRGERSRSKRSRSRDRRSRSGDMKRHESKTLSGSKTRSGSRRSRSRSPREQRHSDGSARRSPRVEEGRWSHSDESRGRRVDDRCNGGQRSSNERRGR